MGIHDVSPTLLIQRAAEELKKDATIKPPVWAMFVKTGMSRERQPTQPDWWYVRSAAILRKIFVLGPVGTEKLRTKFGGRKNEGMAPEHFYKGSGSIIRKILQQLDKAGLSKQSLKNVHKGRIITPKGQQLLEKISSDIMKEQGIVLPAKPVVVETPETKEEKVKKPRAPRKPKVKKAETPAPAAAEAPKAE